MAPKAWLPKRGPPPAVASAQWCVARSISPEPSKRRQHSGQVSSGVSPRPKQKGLVLTGM